MSEWFKFVWIAGTDIDLMDEASLQKLPNVEIISFTKSLKELGILADNLGKWVVKVNMIHVGLNS